MRKKIVAGNWKMNLDLASGKALALSVLEKSTGNESAKLVLGTPAIHLATVAEAVAGKKGIEIAAQNCSDKVSGAYTGEISAEMVKSTGANYVIIGHSERREYFNESNESLATKVGLALTNELTPIFCCGESLEIRESGEHFSFVKNQLTESLKHLSADDFKKIVIAYEPIWAIGTGKTASAAQAQEMHAELRSHLASLFSQELADGCSILYGGSCKPSNAKEIFEGVDVDGGLIGGASLKADDLIAIANSF